MTISAEQRDDRRQGLGSSDAAAILGLNPYMQARDIWASKMGMDEFEGNFSTRLGDHMESFILAEVASQIGKPVVPAPQYRRGVLISHPDGQVEKPDYGYPIVEAKAVHYGTWGEPGTDAVPESIYVQVLHQMHCSESDRAYVARLYGGRGWNLDLYEVLYDLDAAETMERELTAFWEQYVQTGNPPPLDESHQSTDSFLSRIERNAGSVKPVSPDLVREFLDAKRAKAEAEAYEKHLRTKILLTLDDATVGDCPGFVVENKWVNRSRIDTRSMPEELIEPYRVPSGHWRLDVKEAK